MFKPCAVIPVYDHEKTVGAVVDAVLEHRLPCIVVDDGSSAQCSELIDVLVSERAGRVTLIRHTINRGKGAAVLTGIRHAAATGHSHALQIDADGQHSVDDIPRFLERAATYPQALIVGCPTYDETVPLLRFYGRYLTHAWVSINTLSRQIKDSMCGFRVYPLPPLVALDRRKKLGSRMSFDIEVLVRLYWDGVEIINVPTPVAYNRDGVSHFRGFLDNALISRAHATLFFGMLLRLPMLIARRRSIL
jgi:glycosyltransferase involved in cell wall biosynthesis